VESDENGDVIVVSSTGKELN